ncbi:hypothetical protein G9A89_005677 [Geosiphon pyriformis]|nr:hypothetical protein G9A89_005677 [Geosiphon pyriformis]
MEWKKILEDGTQNGHAFIGRGQQEVENLAQTLTNIWQLFLKKTPMWFQESAHRLEDTIKQNQILSDFIVFFTVSFIIPLGAFIFWSIGCLVVTLCFWIASWSLAYVMLIAAGVLVLSPFYFFAIGVGAFCAIGLASIRFTIRVVRSFYENSIPSPSHQTFDPKFTTDVTE